MINATGEYPELVISIRNNLLRQNRIHIVLPTNNKIHPSYQKGKNNDEIYILFLIIITIRLFHERSTPKITNDDQFVIYLSEKIGIKSCIEIWLKNRY